MSDDLRDRLAAALRQIRFGLSPGRHYGLSGNEVEQAAEQLLPTVQGELEWWQKARQDDLDQIGRLSVERDAALATLTRVREMAERMAALAPPDDWGESMSDTALADAGRAMLAALAGPAGTAGTCSGWLSDVEHIEMTLPIGENAMGRLLADLIVAIQSKWDAEYGEPDAAMAADAALEWLEARTIEPAGSAGAGSTQDGAR